jgi:Mg2+/Co2+ transporter CorB
MSIEVVYIILFCICLLLSAFFASSETAFFSLQRFRLEHHLSSHVRGADRVARLMERPEKLLSVILLGNNLVNTAAAALATALALRYWPEQGVLIAIIGATVILLVFGETTPKTLATQHAERLSRAFARPIGWLSWLLTPFVVMLSWIADRIHRISGG